MKKNVVLIALILSVVILLTGCAASVPNPPPNVQPSTYTIHVVSSCWDCWGNIYVNGLPSGEYLQRYGGAYVNNVPAGAAIRLEDEWGSVGSNVQIFQPPNTTIIFTWF
jgi:starvation-inducible outer membrane lipoprotein